MPKRRSPRSSSSLADPAQVGLHPSLAHRAGKGTVSSTLKEKLGWIPISAGDCLREEKARFCVLSLRNGLAEARTPS